MILLRVEYQRLVLLEVGRDEALAGSQGLLAYVVLGYAAELRIGNFQVVAENFVVANLQIGDAGALTLAALQPGDPLAALSAAVLISSTSAL